MAEDIIKAEAPKKTTKKKAPAKKAEPKMVVIKALRTYISKEGKEIREGTVLDLEKKRADALVKKNFVEILKQ